MLDLFATDPEAREKKEATRAPRNFERPTFDFQFRSGMLKNRLPVSLQQWRVTTPHQSIADAFVENFGGTIGEDRSGQLAVSTDTSEIEIVVTGPIEAKLIQWQDGFPVHECDGAKFLSHPDDHDLVGTPCSCPPTIEEKKDRARQRPPRGPKPNITIPFRLANDYELGQGKYVATAWTFAEDLPWVLAELAEVGGEALCKLGLEHIEYKTQAGEKREFTKPYLKVVGSYNDAIAEER